MHRVTKSQMTPITQIETNIHKTKKEIMPLLPEEQDVTPTCQVNGVDNMKSESLSNACLTFDRIDSLFAVDGCGGVEQGEAQHLVECSKCRSAIKLHAKILKVDIPESVNVVLQQKRSSQVKWAHEKSYPIYEEVEHSDSSTSACDIKMLKSSFVCFQDIQFFLSHRRGEIPEEHVEVQAHAPDSVIIKIENFSDFKHGVLVRLLQDLPSPPVFVQTDTRKLENYLCTLDRYNARKFHLTSSRKFDTKENPTLIYAIAKTTTSPQDNVLALCDRDHPSNCGVSPIFHKAFVSSIFKPESRCLSDVVRDYIRSVQPCLLRQWLYSRHLHQDSYHLPCLNVDRRFGVESIEVLSQDYSSWGIPNHISEELMEYYLNALLSQQNTAVNYLLHEQYALQNYIREVDCYKFVDPAFSPTTLSSERCSHMITSPAWKYHKLSTLRNLSIIQTECDFVGGQQGEQSCRQSQRWEHLQMPTLDSWFTNVYPTEKFMEVRLRRNMSLGNLSWTSPQYQQRPEETQLISR